ncbi:transcriptional regulator [Williamsia sp. Leaf354]|uniref:SRPBCC family protein n=1 Tax=Williamsia sp. Leaf354 TaxID=1736349 RepID=UPI0006F7AD65|nr:SRPBCC family protein [Williamsia sp. Leaf354]KQR99892.1 transcriptional regulator [Williamsia sp. Leaf354]
MAPSAYTVTRSIDVAAPADVVYALIADFHHWTTWSPWEQTDPNVERSYSGPDSGVGASYAWKGNRKAGAGSMAITDVEPRRRITIALEFLKPFKSTSTVVFTIAEQINGTTGVEWTMTGDRSGIAKLMTKVVPMDKLIGGDFARGLEQLKARAESAV